MGLFEKAQTEVKVASMRVGYNYMKLWHTSYVARMMTKS